MYDVLLPGFPARGSRGFLGWSSVVLLRTGEGPVLFDTGGAGDRPGLLAALSARGLSADDIRTVVLSHLHFDHMANVECFPVAQVVVHQTEFNYFCEHRCSDPALHAFAVDGMLAKSRLQLIHGELMLFPGVRMLHVPGHTAGQCALAITCGDEVHILAQDAVKNRWDLAATTAAGSFNSVAASASIARIASMADVIVPGHDTTLRKIAGIFAPDSALRTEIVTANGCLFSMEIPCALS